MLIFGQKYGVINSIVLSRSGESDNVYLRDEESVEENGLTEVKIVDNQIMNFNNRSDYLQGILNALNGLYYYLNDFNSTGVLYYEVGDLYNVQIGENTYQCLMLNDEVNVTTGIEEIIHTDMPEKSETDYSKADKTDMRINKTYLIVDKQNQTIESVVNNVTEQNNKISQITQTVDELNSKISDIADITTYGESNRAEVELTDINESEPIMIKVHPTNMNISYYYPMEVVRPNPGFYPDNSQYLNNRIIRFTRTYEENGETLTENIDYELPDDLLVYSDTVYDEFYLDYESQTCQIIKRCEYKENYHVKPLENQIIIDVPYPQIILGEGNYKISLPNYPFGYLFVRLMAQNIYTTQFYTKVETDSRIDQKADEINLGVSQTLTNYSTTNEMNSAITLKANEITSTVSNTYETKNNAQSNYSQLQQTANNISSVVSTKVGEDEIISKINQSSESVSISAGKINLNGAVTANQYFKINTDGSMEARNGTFTGGTIELKDNGSATGSTCLVVKSDNFKSNFSSTGMTVQPINSSILRAALYSNSNGFNFYLNNGKGSIISFKPTEVSFSGLDTFKVNCPITQGSLESLKKNIEKYTDNALSIIKDSEIYMYNFKTEKNTEKKHIGFVIGDLGGKYKTPKQVIAKDKNGIDTYDMTSILWKAVQEQQEQIEQMKKEIKELKGGK